MTLAHHVTARLVDDRVLAPSAAARRVAARALSAVGAGAVLAFAIADTHLHFIVLGDRPAAGALTRALLGSASARLGLRCPFEPARFRPIVDQHHLANAVRYVLKQQAHHALGDLDPFLDSTSLPDLVGLRVVPGGLPRLVREHLPRLDLRPLALELIEDLAGAEARVRAGLPESLDVLVPSALAASGLVELVGQREAVVRARHAAVHASGHGTRELATTVGLDARSVQRLRSLPVDARLLVATRMQWALRGHRRSQSAARLLERVAREPERARFTACSAAQAGSPREVP